MSSGSHATSFRSASHHELDVLRTLLRDDFQGSAALRPQLNGLQVSELDQNGSLKLRPAGAESTSAHYQIPVEATYLDLDGIDVHVLLHVNAGFLAELEVFREDSRDVILRPGTVQLAVDSHGAGSLRGSGEIDQDRKTPNF